MKIKQTTLLLSGLLLCGGAFAQNEGARSTATLVEIEGNVMVNTGEQFVKTADGAVLASGDRVMAMDESGALLKYSDGCDVRIEPATVVTLSEGSPCAGWMLTVESVAPTGKAIGAAGATRGGLSPWIYVPAIAVAGVLIFDELDDGPSSP